jgi:hypothetical protein
VGVPAHLLAIPGPPVEDGAMRRTPFAYARQTAVDWAITVVLVGGFLWAAATADSYERRYFAVLFAVLFAAGQVWRWVLGRRVQPDSESPASAERSGT